MHILMDGDCLQTQNNIRIFCRQLQWAMQHCKRRLNGEAAEEVSQSTHQSVQAVSLQTSGAVAEGDDDRGAVVVDKMEAVTASTNTSDDYMHRGAHLHSMCLYVCRMCVRRVRRSSQAATKASNVFHFDPHYVLARSYSQEVVLHNAHVPTIDGFQCPTVQQDAEQNALLKALLFTPLSCVHPMMCGKVMNSWKAISNGS